MPGDERQNTEHPGKERVLERPQTVLDCNTQTFKFTLTDAVVNAQNLGSVGATWIGHALAGLLL